MDTEPFKVAAAVAPTLDAPPKETGATPRAAPAAGWSLSVGLFAPPGRRRPRLLDLFCGAGGCAKGYQRAGFTVVGVDHRPQPHYCGDAFVRADALEFLEQQGAAFDAIHASPPCQAYSASTRGLRSRGRAYPDLIGPLRATLQGLGRPYVIENVVGAPLRDPVLLCGSMFGLGTYRHRLFEASFPVEPPPHYWHADGERMYVVGHFSDVPAARRAMGIEWMVRDELAQAIPPAYTEWLGRALRDLVVFGEAGYSNRDGESVPVEGTEGN